MNLLCARATHEGDPISESRNQTMETAMPRRTLSVLVLLGLVAAAFSASPAAADFRGKAQIQAHAQAPAAAPMRGASNLDHLQTQQMMNQRQRALQMTTNIANSTHRTAHGMLKNCPQCF